MAEVPHFDLPFRFEFNSAGELHAAVNEQDSYEDVAACVTSIVRTPLGYREEMPDFGIRDQTFSAGGINTEDIQTAISLWEPRAEVLIEEDESMLDQFVSIARVIPERVIQSTSAVDEEDS